MPLMKVRKGDAVNGQWETVTHLNFKTIGFENLNLQADTSHIYVFSTNNDNLGTLDKANYVIAYTEDIATLDQKIADKKYLSKIYIEINTEFSTEAQQNNEKVNNEFNNLFGSKSEEELDSIKKGFLIEHRKIGSITFNLLHFYDNTSNKWMPLNGIFG